MNEVELKLGRIASLSVKPRSPFFVNTCHGSMMGHKLTPGVQRWSPSSDEHLGKRSMMLGEHPGGEHYRNRGPARSSFVCVLRACGPFEEPV